VLLAQSIPVLSGRSNDVNNASQQNLYAPLLSQTIQRRSSYMSSAENEPKVLDADFSE
jgi:hypothetical protein